MRACAAVIAALLLVAGCSETGGGRTSVGSSTTTAPTSQTPPPATPTSSTAPSRVPPAVPTAGAPMADIIAWIQAGQPADPHDFHNASREGTVTPLQDNDVAFTTPSGKTSCMTDSMFSNGDLACLVKLTNPPPRPNAAEGHWMGDWVDYDGVTLTVGSVHGDPGRFIYGDGGKLDYGKTLKFADYQCRVDQAGLFCVNFAHQSAARLSDAGVEPFGCLQKVPPPDDIGVKYAC